MKMSMCPKICRLIAARNARRSTRVLSFTLVFTVVLCANADEFDVDKSTKQPEGTLPPAPADASAPCGADARVDTKFVSQI